MPEFKQKHPKYNARLKHINRFLSLRCAADLLIAGFVPNAKEVSESMAAVAAVETYLCHGRLTARNENTAVVCVGDGKTPRTASLFAFMTKWQCYSVDPSMEHIHGVAEFNGIRTERLHIIGRKIQDSNLYLSGFENVIVVSVHSHATNKNVLDGIAFIEADFVAIPCCVAQPPLSSTYHRYVDHAIWSPHNEVIISYGVNGTQSKKTRHKLP